MALDDKIPAVNGVSSTEEYDLERKFIQLYVDGEPYLRIAEDSTNHNYLLRNFIDECKTAGEKIGTDQELEELSWDFSACAPLSMQRYEVVGMGTAKISGREYSIIFGGDSYDYGLTPNKDHLTKIEIHLPDWKLSVGVD